RSATWSASRNLPACRWISYRPARIANRRSSSDILSIHSPDEGRGTEEQEQQRDAAAPTTAAAVTGAAGFRHGYDGGCRIVKAGRVSHCKPELKHRVRR